MPDRNNNMYKKLFYALLISGLFFVEPLQAQQASDDLGTVFHTGVILFFVFVFFILIAFLVYHNRPEDETPTLAKVWKAFSNRMSAAVPVEKETDILLDHNYDGIRELDNVLPPWWKYLFYVTIVFAVIYMLNYHVFNIMPSSDAEYRAEMQIAELQKAELAASGGMVNENTVTRLTDQNSINLGAESFKKNCVGCHGMNGEGIIGPNLTDDYWIHGGGIKNVFVTIANGVPDKGMTTWKTFMSPREIQQVASFVLSLKGSNPPKAKAPQGNLWVEPEIVDTVKTKK